MNLKKTLFLFAGLLFLATASETHAFERSQRIEVDEVLNKRNIVITNPVDDERYLLYLSTGCSVFDAGQTVTLTLRGPLNSAGDSIREDALHRCRIERAHQFNQKYFVDFVFTGNTEARVTNESGDSFFMRYPSTCSAMPRYSEEHIYLLGRTSRLQQGDRIYLPNKDGQCNVTFVREIRSTRDRNVTETSGDIQRPSQVTHVKALTGNNEIFLNWRRATDNVGISHYLVSHDSDSLNTRNAGPDALPNIVRADSNNLTISDLENNRRYYFYVLAVDTSGNVSSEWSAEVIGTPKPNVLSSDRETVGGQFLNLELAHESRRSFLFTWDPPSDTQRQTVILEVDGAREIVRHNYPSKRFRVLKRSQRAGKRLKLIVQAFDIVSLRLKDEIEFEF